MESRYLFTVHIFVWFDRPVNFEKRYHHLQVEKRFFETQHCHHHGDGFFRDSWLIIISTLLIYILFGLVMGQDITED